jgi:hypothetical protein
VELAMIAVHSGPPIFPESYISFFSMLFRSHLLFPFGCCCCCCCCCCMDYHLFYRYMEIPVVSRLYLTGAFLTTAACAVDIISPFSLYFNWNLVFSQGQVWRLFTSYLFFGVFSIDFLFHMYFLVRCFIADS